MKFLVLRIYFFFLVEIIIYWVLMKNKSDHKNALVFSLSERVIVQKQMS